jgi:hypothetical protein
MKFFVDDSPLRQCTFLLTIVFLSGAASLSAQKSMATAEELHLEIQTERSAYSVGDSIFVGLALRNVADHEVDIPSATPTALAILRVRDEHGEPAKITLPIADGYGSGPGRSLGVGKELRVLGSQKTSQGTATGRGSTTWINLAEWGYDIRAPGRYTITGFPLVPMAQGAGFTFDTTTRSNQAKFTINAE